MLELPRDTTMKRFTFGEVLGASDLIVQKLQDLKARKRCPSHLPTVLLRE